MQMAKYTRPNKNSTEKEQSTITSSGKLEIEERGPNWQNENEHNVPRSWSEAIKNEINVWADLNDKWTDDNENYRRDADFSIPAT